MKAPAFWNKNTGISSLLEPIGLLYAAMSNLRRSLTTPFKADVPVICIGNIVAGGAGKTPVALSVAELLKARGLTPHFLSRGYGGTEKGPLQIAPNQHTSEQVGDEPLLLAQAAPTWISRNRPAGARAAAKAGADIIIMDDGFQNPTLHQDISIVVVDGGYGFGNRRVLPSGPLRETVQGGLKRASGVVILGPDKRKIGPRLPKGLPLLRGTLQPGPEASTLKEQRVVAFAGIGRPEKFLDTLKALDAAVLAWHPFADHYPYAEKDIQPILDEAFGIDAIPVTTAKDAVRLPRDQRQQVTVLTVACAWDNEESLIKLLEPVLSQ